MLRGRDIPKRRRAGRFTLEWLEDRVELSAAGGGAQVMVEVDAVNSQLQAKFARLDAFVVGRIAQLDQGSEAALTQAGETDDGETLGYKDRAPTFDQIVRDYNRFVRHVDLRVKVLTTQTSRAIDRVDAQSGRLDSTTDALIASDSTQLRTIVAAIGNNFQGEAEAARDAAGRLLGPVHAAIFQASTYGLSAMGAVDAADADLAQISQSQQASDQADDAALVGAYNSAFVALQSQVATLPSSPSSSIAGGPATSALGTGTVAGTTGTGAIGPGIL